MAGVECGGEGKLWNKQGEIKDPTEHRTKFDLYLLSKVKAMQCSSHGNERWVCDVIRTCSLERSLRLQYREIYLWVGTH